MSPVPPGSDIPLHASSIVRPVAALAVFVFVFVGEGTSPGVPGIAGIDARSAGVTVSAGVDEDDADDDDAAKP